MISTFFVATLFALAQLFWGWRHGRVWGEFRMVSRQQRPWAFRLAMCFWAMLAFGSLIALLTTPIPTHVVVMDLPAPQH